MSKNDPFSQVKRLVGDIGFKDKEELGSFCLAVGLFHDDPRSDPPRPPRNWDPSNYDIWSVAQVISYVSDPTIEDMKGMKQYLYPYLLSGIEIVERRIKGKNGTEMFESLRNLIPL